MNWQELLDLLNTIPPDQLDQPAQLIVYDSCYGIDECLPIIHFSDIQSLELPGCRCVSDNKYHGEQFVLLADNGNGFAEDGAISYELLDGEFVNPYYGIHGPTKPEDQRNPDYPRYELIGSRLSPEHAKVLSHRSKTNAEAVRASQELQSTTEDTVTDHTVQTNKKTMNSALTVDQQSAIEDVEKLFHAAEKQLDIVCRAVIEKICRERDWNFISGYHTDFYTGSLSQKKTNQPWPEEFRQLFDWAEEIAYLPDMCFEDGEWIA